MEVFQTTLWNFRLLGINPYQPLNVNLFTVTPIVIWSHISNCMFLLHVASTFQEYTLSINSTSTTTLIILVYVAIVWNMGKLLDFINFLESLAKINLLAKSKIYETTQQVQKLSKIVCFVVLQLFPPGTMLPGFIVSFIVYYKTGSGEDAFQLPLAMWYPFNWKTPKGYICAFTLQYVVVVIGFLFGACVALLGISSVMYFFVVTKKTKEILDSANTCCKRNVNRLRTLKHLINFVRLHAMSKRLIHDLDGIFQPMITALFAWSLTTICGTLLVFQTNFVEYFPSDSFDLIVFVVPILNMLWVLFLLFVACELGERVINEFNEIHNVICTVDWYKFPKRSLQILPIILMLTQKAEHINCFGQGIVCTRELFQKTINNGYSYFMVLRGF